MAGQLLSGRRPVVVLAGAAAVCCITVITFSFATGRIADAVAMPVGLPAVVAGVLLTAFSPRRFGWTWADTGRRWRAVVGSLALVLGVVGAYRLSGGGGPYEPSLAEFVIVPVGEELLFRGFMLTLLFDWFRRVPPEPTAARRAITIGAVSFGLGHLGNFGYVPTSFVLLQGVTAILFGLLAGWLRLTTRSVIAPVLLHATLNIAAVT